MNFIHTWIIGKTGHAFIDVWTLAHFSFWLFIGSCLWALKVNRPIAIATCMILAYGWEIFEKFAEHRWPDKWLNPESWLNSLISDPLTCILGLAVMWYALDNWRM